MPTAEPTVGRWRGGWAGVLSVLLHGLLAAALLLRARAPRVAELVSSAPIEIELNVVAPPPFDRTIAEPAADRAHGQRGRSRDVSTTPPARSTAPPKEAVASDAPSAFAHDRKMPPASSFQQQPSTSDRGAAPAPALSFEALAPSLQYRLAAAPFDAALAIGAHKASVAELRVERERQEDAVANVEAGRVDPLLYDYLRGARVRLEDEAKRIAERLPIGAGQTIRGWGRGLVQRVGEIHRGDRVADQVQPDLRDEAQRRRPDLAAAYDENRRQAEAGAEIRRTEICLDVAPGHDTTTSLRRGSGNAALDRLALDAFARAVSMEPVPPDARAGRACYEVRIAAYRAGPGPGVSCNLDLFGKHGPTCVWPLKKITTVTSQLSSVEYPAKPGVPANQSLLRSAR